PSSDLRTPERDPGGRPGGFARPLIPTSIPSIAGRRARSTVAQQDNAEVDALWHRLKDTGDQSVRDQLILHYSPLVKYVAGRVAVGLPQNVEQSDLVSYGIFGLIDAIEKFDPQRGYKFETYAIARIKGAILDELRSIDWVPRSVRAKARALETAYARLASELHRTPTDDELAAELGYSNEQLQTVLSQISFVGLVALDEMLSVGGDRGESLTLGDTIADGAEGPVGLYEVEEMPTGPSAPSADRKSTRLNSSHVKTSY